MFDFFLRLEKALHEAEKEDKACQKVVSDELLKRVNF